MSLPCGNFEESGELISRRQLHSALKLNSFAAGFASQQCSQHRWEPFQIGQGLFAFFSRYPCPPHTHRFSEQSSMFLTYTNASPREVGSFQHEQSRLTYYTQSGFNLHTELDPVLSMMQAHKHADAGSVCMGLSQTKSKLPFPTEVLLPPHPHCSYQLATESTFLKSTLTHLTLQGTNFYPFSHFCCPLRFCVLIFCCEQRSLSRQPPNLSVTYCHQLLQEEGPIGETTPSPK